MGNIGDELKKSLNRLGITRQVEAVGVVEQAKEEIAKFIPEEDFEVVSFKSGTLKISSCSSSTKSEIRFKLSPTVQKELGIKKVVFISKLKEDLAC